MSLIDRLKTNSRLKDVAMIKDSAVFGDIEFAPTDIPMMNVALSGDIHGGLQRGLLQIAGPSKHFKTSLGLTLLAAHMKKFPKAVCLFYDTEFGAPESYFAAFGVDTDRVIHCPVKNIEELKFDIIKQLDELEKKDEVVIMIDSIGNIASKKEVDDALKENTAADMTRAKQLKGLFRVITPYLTLKSIPMIAINHTYMEQGMFPKAIVSGGTGAYYSSNDIWVIGRRQQKVGTEVVGYEFIINIEKSRTVKEKSKIPITVSWDGGIIKYSGLLDVALEGGYVIKPKNAWYMPVNPADGELLAESNVRQKETMKKEFWDVVFEKTDFRNYICVKYRIPEIVEVDESE